MSGRGTRRGIGVGIAGLSEVVFACALAAAAVRFTMGQMRRFADGFDFWSSLGVYRIGGAVLAGIAAAGGIGLLLERARGHRRPAWGPGRWTWSLSGLTLALNVAWSLGFLPLLVTMSGRRGQEGFPDYPTELLENLRRIIGSLLGMFSVVIAAFLVTSRLAPGLKDDRPDAREWSGRFFAVAVVLTWLLYEILDAFGK